MSKMFEKMRHTVLLIVVLALSLISCKSGAYEPAAGRPSPLPSGGQSGYQQAAQYSAERGGVSFLVMQNGRAVFEDYPGSSRGAAHKLASGTKSFWGVAAAVAVSERLFSWDERAADTLTEWRSDPQKSRITVRQILNFTSGLDPSSRTLQGTEVTDKFLFAVNDIALKASPGAQFLYGPSHLTAFGEFMSRKLKASGQDDDPLHYLERKVLDPIGLEVAGWNRDGARNPIMPAGAALAATEWAKYGQLILEDGRWNGKTVVRADLLHDLFQGSQPNPGYGLTFWLNREPGVGPTAAGADGAVGKGGRNGAKSSEGGRRGGGGALKKLRQQLGGGGGRRQRQRDEEPPQQSEARAGRTAKSGYIYEDGPRDLVMAAGSGNQRLYIIPSQNMVVVRQAEKSGKKGGRFVDSEFLALILN